MTLYHDIDELYKNKQYIKVCNAVDLYFSNEKREVESLDDIFAIYEKCRKIINSKYNRNIYYNFAKSFYLQGMYLSSISICESIEKKDTAQLYRVYVLHFNSLINNGEIKKTKLITKRIIQYLKNRKNIKLLEDFKNIYLRVFKLDSIVIEIEELVLLFNGNLDNLVTKYSSLDEINKKEFITRNFNYLYKRINNLMFSETLVDDIYSYTKKFYMINVLDEIKRIYYILLLRESASVLLSLFRYSVDYKRRKLGRLLSYYISRNIELNNDCNRFFESQKDKLDKLEKVWESESSEELEELDLGEDLMDKTFVGDLDKILNNQSYNSESRFVSSVGDKQKKVIDDLLLEVSKYSTEVKENDFSINMISKTSSYLKKYISSKNFNETEFCGKITALILMNLADDAISVIDTYIEKNKKHSINVLVLKLEAYRICSKYYDGLDLIEEIITDESLLNDQVQNLLYTKAEFLKKIGRNSEAFRLYRELYVQNKDFRILKYRLKEFE